jgi:SAM-dependent methyltransferase
MSREPAVAVAQHYGGTDALEAILAGLRTAGKDPERLRADDLAPVDQFHARGKDATLDLAALAGIRADLHVLDIGGGFGGPARMLAERHGCRVTVLDVTEAYCRLGEELTRRTGLGHLVTFHHGDALAMPFADGTFDLAWTQHSTMNIEDKPGLYREIHRALRADGRLAMHEIVSGPSHEPVLFPVPWSRELATNFVRSADEMRALIAAAGFRERAWRDTSEASIAWFRNRVAAAQRATAPAPLGLHLVFGPVFGPMFRNLLRNLEDGRIAVVEALWDRD